MKRRKKITVALSDLQIAEQHHIRCEYKRPSFCRDCYRAYKNGFIDMYGSWKQSDDDLPDDMVNDIGR
jgi:hypothetical protein